MKARRTLSSLAYAALTLSTLTLVGTSAQAEERAEPPEICWVAPDETAFEVISAMVPVGCDDPHNTDIVKEFDYPENRGAPSTWADRAGELFGSQCSQQDVLAWLGASKYKMPLRVLPVVRLPTDELWEAGARWVACVAVRYGADSVPVTYSGWMPDALAAGPLIDWVTCAVGTPKSGRWPFGNACTGDSKWVVIGGVQVKGKIGPKYPKDMQAKANALCAKKAQGLLKPGAKGKPFGALGPKKAFPRGNPVAECLIPLDAWTGRGR